MDAILSPAAADIHLVFFQGPRPRAAKVETDRFDFLQERRKRAEWGALLHRVPRLMNLSDKEFAARLKVSEQVLGNWHAGEANAAMWRYYADPDVFVALQWAQAEAKGYIRPAVIELPPLKVG